MRLPKTLNRVFDRWKYAEEYASELISKGRIISITMVADVSHEEDDGEVYTYDEFIVHDHGKRTTGGERDE